MPRPKSYRLLCPIARALDRVGDRWTLLILRDLHAGPARFSELQHALPGIASNLLSSRLEVLAHDGLVEQDKDGYKLTEQGEASAPLLFELAAYGTRFDPPEEVRRPGNLRTIAVTIKEGLRRVVQPSLTTKVQLIVDGEHFRIDIHKGKVDVRYGAEGSPLPKDGTRSTEAVLSIETDYDALIALGDGRMSAAEFGKNHVQVNRGTQRAARSFLKTMAAAFS